MNLNVGIRYFSVVDDTEVIVIRSSGIEADLTCGGYSMAVNPGGAPGRPAPLGDGGAQLGKRYVDPDGTIEVLCVKAGTQPLAFDGKPMTVKLAKSLPASD